MAKHKVTNIGISINTDWIELAQLSKDGKTIKSRKTPMPMAVMDSNGDRLKDPQTLATSIAAMIAELNAKPPIKLVHVSVPGTLVRIVEMPKVSKTELALALTSEAERYAVFNDTEALIDYAVLSEEPDERQKLLLVALRKDTVAAYQEAFNIARLSLASLDVETITSLRGLKYSGTLDTILSEVGDNPWGTIHFEPERVRIAVWQYDQLKNWREVLLDTSDLKVMGEDAPVIQDLVEEVRRTIGMTRPVLWVTYGIPENLSTALTPRLGTTVRPMLTGTRLNLEDPKISLASIGASSKSYDSFPALVNIQPSSDMQASTGLTPLFKIMLGVSAVLAVIVGIIFVIMFGVNIYCTSTIATTEQQINEQTVKINELQARVTQLNQQNTINKEFADRLNNVIKYNSIFSDIINTIQERIPSTVQLDKMTVNPGSITIEGKSLNYDAINLFLKNFDKSEGVESPISNMSIDSVQEKEELGAKVYTYKFTATPAIN